MALTVKALDDDMNRGRQMGYAYSATKNVDLAEDSDKAYSAALTDAAGLAMNGFDGALFVRGIAHGPSGPVIRKMLVETVGEVKKGTYVLGKVIKNSLVQEKIVVKLKPGELQLVDELEASHPGHLEEMAEEHLPCALKAAQLTPNTLNLRTANLRATLFSTFFLANLSQAGDMMPSSPCSDADVAKFVRDMEKWVSTNRGADGVANGVEGVAGTEVVATTGTKIAASTGEAIPPSAIPAESVPGGVAANSEMPAAANGKGSHLGTDHTKSANGGVHSTDVKAEGNEAGHGSGSTSTFAKRYGSRQSFMEDMASRKPPISVRPGKETAESIKEKGLIFKEARANDPPVDGDVVWVKPEDIPKGNGLVTPDKDGFNKALPYVKVQVEVDRDTGRYRLYFVDESNERVGRSVAVEANSFTTRSPSLKSWYAVDLSKFNIH